jgi:mRNA interferase RelE/StbE
MPSRLEDPRAMTDQAPERDGEPASESGVRYNLLISDEAREQLRALPKPMRRNIGQRLDALQNGLAGDVKKLTAREHKYRLRVGNYRILFRLEGPTIFVYAVKHRKEAYE